MHTIFYSWQSDLISKYNRNFIEESIKKALQNLNKSEDYIVELNLDRDTKGEAGTPDIINTIFKKISNSNIFICDISIINYDSKNKKTPNPNVLLELGYAAAILGWENIICVYNKSYGEVENLPFDLKFRRPILYHYDESNQKDKDSLIKQIEKAIKSSNPEIIEKNKKIQSYYKNESIKSKKILKNKPDYWEFKLLEELFTDKLVGVNKKYTDIERGILFKRNKHLTTKEYLNYMSSEMGFLARTTEGLTYLYNNDLASAIGKPDELLILDFCKNLFNLMENLIQWEIEIRSISTNILLEKSRKLLFNCTKQIVETINTLPTKFNYVYNNPKIQHKIEITFEATPEMFEYIEIMDYYNENIHLFIEE